VIGRRGRPAVLLALTVLLGSACARRLVVEQPTLGQEVFVLLPGEDGGSSGRAIVSSQGSSVEITDARSTTIVSDKRPPTSPRTMGEAEMQHIFGDALTALPPAPRFFNLYFRFESDELTDGSRALVPEILQAVAGRRGAEVVVVGHTDTTGTPTLNYELGLKRARTIRDLLVQAGLDPSLIEVTSHGEGDPLILTADDTLEPRNRRVEIAVR